MSGVCGCGNCRGCVWARAAGDRYDTTEEEAREQAEYEAEQLEIAEQLAEFAPEATSGYSKNYSTAKEKA